LTQEKKAENLRNIYQEMDEERRRKTEHIAEGLLNVQMLVDEEKATFKQEECFIRRSK
jgi:hypothetical protein